MSMFISAVLSDLTSRAMSFLLDKLSTAAIAAATSEETLSSLERLLLRVHVIVEEAEQRHVTNQAMLRQLNQMRKEMYRGHHTLDNIFKCKDQSQAVMMLPSSSTPSRSFNPAKRRRLSSGSGLREQERLREVLVGLETVIRDASELVVFLSGCPRRCRQPYSTYLILDKCMFGRQMEMERIMDFLLQEEVPIDGNPPGVLPIVGPGKVGKSTLIEHACYDDRVRDHFSQIMCFSQNSITDDRTVATLSDCDVIKHRSGANGEERVLVIIQLTGDIDEAVWRKFYSDCKRHVAIGSKIIVASRSDKIARLGTTQPLKVQFFVPEVYWYFFKVRTFGSTDTRDHPKLVSIAMDLAQEMNGCFFGATVFSGLLKANFDAHFWSTALAIVKDFKRVNLLHFGDKCADLWQALEPVFLRRVNKTSSEYLVIVHDYETGFVQDSAQSEGPQMSIRDLLFGSSNFRPRGRFGVLAWRSHIPPHYRYMMNCEVRRPGRVVSTKKPIEQIAS
ncbi:putative disease resistance protein RGA3 [Miscanthus floridulus]|uniref:putative disease resistance protein RGA3 n=1 Tax=Miscanthus floridulus TaxID=154761 RepID=UPI00345A3803